MLRRLFSRPLFRNRRDTRNRKSNDENGSGISADFYFEQCRIGWWPAVSNRDRHLLDALISGRYQLITNACEDVDWAYAAVALGPLHTEIVRWHFPSSRWFRIRKIEGANASNDWCIRWRPLPRPADDRVSGVAQGPFRHWDVLAGEVSRRQDTSQLLIAVILRTTRSNRTAIASECVYSFILVSDNGRTKQGHLLAPAPDDGPSAQSKIPLWYYTTYRQQSQELHLFSYSCDHKQLIWYQYKKRGNRVYWLIGKRKIQLPEAARFSHKLYDIKDGDLFRLVAGLGHKDSCIQFNLAQGDWSILSIEAITNNNHGRLKNGCLQDIRKLCRSGGKGNSIPVPVQLKYSTPLTLTSICVRAILRHAHPKYLNNPPALYDTLPRDRITKQSISELMIK